MTIYQPPHSTVMVMSLRSLMSPMGYFSFLRITPIALCLLTAEVHLGITVHCTTRYVRNNV